MREGTATLATTGQPSSPPAGTLAPAGGWALGWTGFGSERTCGRMCLEASISKTSPQVSGGDQVGSQATGSWRVGESAAGQLRCLRTADGGAALGRLPRRWQSPESHGARGPQGSGVGGMGESLKRGPWTRGVPSLPMPLSTPTWGRQQREAAEQQQQQRDPARRGGALHGRRADKGAGRGSRLRAARAPSSGRASAANAGPRPRGSIIPPRRRARGGRGGGGAAGRPLPSPRPLPAGDLRAPSLLGGPPSWHPSSKGAQAHGRGGGRDPKLLLGGGGLGKGGRDRREAPPPHPRPHTPRPLRVKPDPLRTHRPEWRAGYQRLAPPGSSKSAGGGNPASGSEGSPESEAPFEGK